MSTERWTPLNYTNDSKIPLVGEVILLRYSISTIDFPYGPASAAVLASSHACSHFSSTATGNPKGVRSIMHYILILDVSHDKQNHKIKVVFSPIMSYSSLPFYLPPGSPWDAEQWMTNQATDSQRLHHLPVPASGWVPPASICSDAPILSFGGWTNTRRSWLGMVHVRYEILEIHKVSYVMSQSLYLPNVCVVVSSSKWTGHNRWRCCQSLLFPVSRYPKETE